MIHNSFGIWAALPGQVLPTELLFMRSLVLITLGLKAPLTFLILKVNYLQAYCSDVVCWTKGRCQ